MNPQDARTSLDEINRLQDRTVDEHARHGFSRPYTLVVAVGFFVALASSDFASPWQTVVFLAGMAIIVGVAIVQGKRAPVRRKFSGRELAFYLGAGAVLIVVYIAYSLLAALAVLQFDMPLQHTVSAAATTLTGLALVRPARRAYDSVMRRV